MTRKKKIYHLSGCTIPKIQMHCNRILTKNACLVIAYNLQQWRLVEVVLLDLQDYYLSGRTINKIQIVAKNGFGHSQKNLQQWRFTEVLLHDLQVLEANAEKNKIELGDIAEYTIEQELVPFPLSILLLPSLD